VWVGIKIAAKKYNGVEVADNSFKHAPVYSLGDLVVLLIKETKKNRSYQDRCEYFNH